MAIGTITIGVTPCCGVIERTYETVADGVVLADASTGITHYPGSWGRVLGIDTKLDGDQAYGPYAPTFEHLAKQIDQGVCPDCGKRFR